LEEFLPAPIHSPLSSRHLILQTSHAGAAHQYAPQEQYHDFHDGDTDEEIEMEPAPVVVPNLVMVSDDEEDPEEMIPEEDQPADQPNQEEQAPGEDLVDHLDLEMEEEEQEQEQDEAAEEVIWKVYHYRADGVGIPMADYLRAMVLRLGYDKAPVYHCEQWTHPWFEPHWEVAAILEEYIPCRGVKEMSKNHDVAHSITMDAGIAESARRALYVLSHKERGSGQSPHSLGKVARDSGKESRSSLKKTSASLGKPSSSSGKKVTIQNLSAKGSSLFVDPRASHLYNFLLMTLIMEFFQSLKILFIHTRLLDLRSTKMNMPSNPPCLGKLLLNGLSSKRRSTSSYLMSLKRLNAISLLLKLQISILRRR
jgi:hypothetical protein